MPARLCASALMWPKSVQEASVKPEGCRRRAVEINMRGRRFSRTSEYANASGPWRSIYGNI